MSSGNGELSLAKEDDGAFYDEKFHPRWAPLLVVVFPILPLFWSYHVRITQDHLSFGYNCPYKTVERSGIASAEAFDIDPIFQWGGWGLRFRREGGKWQTGYISKGGPGVKLTMNEKGKTYIYVFSCGDPNRVCEILSPKKKT